MTPKEKSNLLQVGQQVRLKSLSQMVESGPPGVSNDMKQYFGKTVTIAVICRDNSIFRIKEEVRYIFHVDWIHDSCFRPNLPEHLFVID